jgi:hypothetical protein
MRPETNAPKASAVTSQMRKRITATDRNRARDAINGIVKKLNKLQSQTDAVFAFSTF